MFHFGPTWDIKDEEKMEKLSQGVMPILFYYIFQVVAQ